MKNKKEDLGLVVADSEDAFWLRVITDTTKQIIDFKEALKFQENVLEMAKEKVKDKDLLNKKV